MKEQKYSYSQRIGKTTFIVNVKQSESAKKPLNTVFQDICKHEVLGDFFTDKSFNFRKSTKSILTNSTPKAPDTVHALVLRSSSTCLN